MAVEVKPRSEADSQSRAPVLGRRIRGLPRRHRLVRRRVLRTNDRRLGLRLCGALRTQGIETVMVCVVRSVKRPERRVHGPTGITIVLLPAVVSSTRDGFSGSAMISSATRRPFLGSRNYHLPPYLATPRERSSESSWKSAAMPSEPVLRRRPVRHRCAEDRWNPCSSPQGEASGRLERFLSAHSRGVPA